MTRKWVTAALAAAAGVSVCCGLTGRSGAAVVDLTTADEGGLTNLVSVTLDDARGAVPFGAMTGIDLFHYNTGATTGTATPFVSTSNPPAGSRALLLDGDRALNTGVVNPGGSGGLAAGATLATTTAGMSIDFLTPVVNGPGEDVLLIEFAATTAQAFDAVTFSGLTGAGPGFGTPRTSTGFATVTAKEFTGASLVNDAYTEPNPVASLADLESKTTTMSTAFPTPAYHALAIDLTSLGVAEGASVTGLHIQGGIDPVFIAGLPQVPEPSAATLAALAAVGLLGRRRR